MTDNDKPAPPEILPPKSDHVPAAPDAETIMDIPTIRIPAELMEEDDKPAAPTDRTLQEVVVPKVSDD